MANRLFYYLTMNFKLHDKIEHNKDKETITSFQTTVMTPSEFGEHLGVMTFIPYVCKLAERDALKYGARHRNEL